ncbi:MAG: hypothetical protein WBQ34_17965 [Candidatus Acidiferrales bacterium]
MIPQLRRHVSKFAVGVVIFTALATFTQPAVARTCDRACLGGLITEYLNDMVAHNPSALPVTAHVRFTENGSVMKLGQGLWQTASSLGAYRQDILDVRGHTAAAQTVVQEAGKPVLLAVRLKENDGKISQIETMVVRNDKSAVLLNDRGFQKGNEQMAFIPPASQLNSREQAIKIAMYYPEGLKVGSFVQVNVPFAPGAYRIENGIHTAGPGCARAGCENIKTQKIIKHPNITARVAAVDDRLGIVLLYLNFGHTKQYEKYGTDSAWLTFEAFKVYGGQIHAVNAILRMASASAGSGWGGERPVKVPPAS